MTHSAEKAKAADPVWEVVLTHEQSALVYVQAATQKEAEAAAVELVESMDWDTTSGYEESRQVTPEAVAAESMRYWTGGPEGEWVYP